MNLRGSFISAYDKDRDIDIDYGVGSRRRGGYIKTHSKHKSSFKMAHEHEHGHESVKRFRRDDRVELQQD